MSDDLLKPECSLPPGLRGYDDLESIDPRSVKAAVILSNLRWSLKYDPVCFALNAITERLIFGEQPLPQEIEDAKKVLANAGFRIDWENRDYAPGVYGYPAEDDSEEAEQRKCLTPRLPPP